MESKIDRVEDSTLGTRMLINYSSHYSDEDNWVNLEDFSERNDFIDLIFLKLTGKIPNIGQKELFLKTLTLTSMGVGSQPPSVFIPKTIASTTKSKRFALINGLLGGLASFGTHHLGAVYDVMNHYKELNVLSVAQVKTITYNKIKNKRIIYGFGHPSYEKDPRPEIILDKLKKEFKKTKLFRNYNAVSEILLKEKRIYPNIDGIVGLSYSLMGFYPEHGLFLSFLARSLSMACHIFEEIDKKPFSFFLNNSVI